MPDILKPVVGRLTYMAFRAKTVLIDNFRGASVASVKVEPEWAELDETKSFIPDPQRGHRGENADPFTFDLKDIGTEVYSITDPVTRTTVKVSGYGIAQLIIAALVPKLLDNLPEDEQSLVEIVE